MFIRLLRGLLLACTMLPLAGLAKATGTPTTVIQCGKASWYELRGKTASGEQADPEVMAAAHRTLPLGARVRVTNLTNGRSVTVRINDRGPFVKHRIIDVTRAAARHLGFIQRGTVRVRVTAGPTRSGSLCR